MNKDDVLHEAWNAAARDVQLLFEPMAQRVAEHPEKNRSEMMRLAFAAGMVLGKLRSYDNLQAIGGVLSNIAESTAKHLEIDFSDPKVQADMKAYIPIAAAKIDKAQADRN